MNYYNHLLKNDIVYRDKMKERGLFWRCNFRSLNSYQPKNTFFEQLIPIPKEIYAHFGYKNIVVDSAINFKF